MERTAKGTFAQGHIGWNKGTGWHNEKRTCKCGTVFNPGKKFQKSCSQHCAMVGTQRRKGFRMSAKTKKKLKNTFLKKGHIPWNKGAKGKVVGYWLGKKRPEISGTKSFHWRGGITLINEKIRKSLEYRLWRKSVFEKDNWTCVLCKKHGGRLHADHIKSFSKYPKLRLELSNGRTLCKSCHLTTENYGYKANKK